MSIPANTNPSSSPAPRLYGILVTYRRRDTLPAILDSILAQSRPPDCLVVVDNEDCAETRQLIQGLAAEAPTKIEYLTPGTNLGSAGGWAFGMEHALRTAADQDWVIPLDDDDPPQENEDFEHMMQFAQDMRAQQPRVAAVGVVGARFDWRRGRVERLKDDEIAGIVEVDILGSGHLPFYSAAVLREQGVFDKGLFFGFTEIEFGLRLRRAGYRLLANGAMWAQRRQRARRYGIQVEPSRRCVISWRRYYVMRNYIYTMTRMGRPGIALRYAAIQLLLKPVYTCFRHLDPITAFRGGLLAARAVRDGFLGRMGRRLQPTIEPGRNLARAEDQLADLPSSGPTSPLHH